MKYEVTCLKSKFTTFNNIIHLCDLYSEILKHDLEDIRNYELLFGGALGYNHYNFGFQTFVLLIKRSVIQNKPA
jgi:hypothetical protein